MSASYLGKDNMETGQILLYAFIGLLFVLWIRRVIRGASIPGVSESEAIARARAGKALLVDVRTSRERSRNTLQGSIHLPLNELSKIEEVLKNHGGREIVFFCATGSRSISAAIRAKKLGFNAANLTGGIG